MKKLNTHIKAITIFIISALPMLFTGSAYAQQSDSEELSLSIDASYGSFSVLTYGNDEGFEADTMITVDLRYQTFMGQLDLIYILPESVDNPFLMAGMGFFSSLGYRVEVLDKIHIPVMGTGGASIKECDAYGLYKDVSPQVGFTLAPYYMFNESLSLIICKPMNPKSV